MKFKVLHIVWNLEAGGIQTWLLALAKHFDHERFSVDFAVYQDFGQSFASDLRALGCQVHLLGENPKRSLEALFSETRYDVTHLHVCPKLNPLAIAKDFKVPLRIFHNHNSLSNAKRVYQSWSFSRGGFRGINARLSVSRKAAFSKFGWRAFLPGYFRVQPAGINLDPFSHNHDPAKIRHAMGIPERSFVIGHVGRLVGFKNHSFLLEIASHLRRWDTDFRLLLIGDGPEREKISQRAHELGIREHLIFAGTSSDVAQLLCGAMDVFVFPSTLGEGLPLALVEAQAAGLPCLVSHRVSRESAIIPSLIHWRSLGTPAEDWAELAMAVRHGKMDRQKATRLIENSPLNAKKTAQDLENFYLSRLLA